MENVERVTRRAEVFDGARRVSAQQNRVLRSDARAAVVERPLEWLQQPGVDVLKAQATGVDAQRQVSSVAEASGIGDVLSCSCAQVLRVVCADGRHEELPYDRLCVASGARPRQLACAASHAVLQLRDTDDVRALAARLNTARRVLLVGNGGIALELVCVLQALASVSERAC